MKGFESGCGENSNESTCSVKTGNWMSILATVGISGRTFLSDIGCYSL